MYCLKKGWAPCSRPLGRGWQVSSEMFQRNYGMGLNTLKSLACDSMKEGEAALLPTRAILGQVRKVTPLSPCPCPKA